MIYIFFTSITYYCESSFNAFFILKFSCISYICYTAFSAYECPILYNNPAVRRVHYAFDDITCLNMQLFFTVCST